MLENIEAYIIPDKCDTLGGISRSATVWLLVVRHTGFAFPNHILARSSRFRYYSNRETVSKVFHDQVVSLA